MQAYALSIIWTSIKWVQHQLLDCHCAMIVADIWIPYNENILDTNIRVQLTSATQEMPQT